MWLLSKAFIKYVLIDPLQGWIIGAIVGAVLQSGAAASVLLSSLLLGIFVPFLEAAVRLWSLLSLANWILQFFL